MLSSILLGWRSWKSARVVGLLALLALAIGIGSTTAIYTVVRAVMLKPLPYANPERYFFVFGAWRPHVESWTVFSYPDYRDYLPQTRTLDAFGVYTPGDFNVTVNHQAMHVVGVEASASLLRSFGVAPALGRWYDDREQTGNALPGAVISMALWRRSGSDPNILGKVLTMNGEQFTVMGIAPVGFRFPVEEAHNDVWVPVAQRRSNRAIHDLRAVGKLKAGVTPRQATEDLNRIQASMARQYPGLNEADVIVIRPLLDLVLEDIRPSLLLLLGAAVALLMITCANVASLLLARSVGRARETATRVALGASGWQLGIQYFTEGLLVSCAGAAAGAFLSVALVHAVLQIAADEIPRADGITLDLQVLFFTLAVAVACAVLFSLAPLWQAHQTAPNAVLSQGTRASAGSASRKLLRLFVVAEIALSFGLLAIGGIAREHLNDLRHVHPGFDSNNLLTLNIFAPNGKYRTDPALIQYESALGQALRQVPGVENAGFISLLPLLDWGNNTWMYVEGRPKLDIGHSVSIESRRVSPEYFESMRIPLIRGRFFTGGDKHGSIMPILINQTLAKLYWKNENPIGAYVTVFGLPPLEKLQVVGVVGDARNQGLNKPPLPEYYYSFREFAGGHMSWAIRSSIDPMRLVPRLRRAVLSVDPDQPIFDIRLMSSVIQTSLVNQRLESLMVGFFATAALLLSVLGVYGVVAYAIRQRLTEMGTRMALGAGPGDLLRLVLKEGLKIAAFGIAIGLVLVLLLGRLLQQAPQNTSGYEVLPLTSAALLIAACTLLACWIPARRASSLSPMVAIRDDLHPSLARLRVSFHELTGRVSALMADGRHTGPGAEMWCELSAVSRNAESFAEALQLALVKMRDDVRASSATLLTHRLPTERFHVAATTFEHRGANATLPSDSLLLRRLKNYSSALPLPPDDLAAWRHWSSEHAPHYLPEIETLEDLGAELAIAVFSKESIVGILLLGSPLGRAEFSSAERRGLRNAAPQIALMLENARLTERIIEQERFTRDLELAGEVQKRLFPQPWREDAPLQLVGTSIPARGVGGDCYDFLDLGNRQVGVALADVAGKGIAAALVTSIVQATLRSLADQNGHSLADLASNMNRLLFRSTGTNSYATFFYAQFDEATRRLRYVNAGHNPPFLLRTATDCIEELATGGTIIGMFNQATYQEATVELAHSDVLLLFSDGVSEANDPNENEFGEDRLKDLLRSTAHLPIKEMAAAILEELKHWMGDAPQFDDLTFVLVKVV